MVSADGQSVNKMKRFQAEQIARDKGLKLVLVTAAAGEAQPIPQYRLMSNLEYRTELKYAKQAKRMDRLPELKTLKLNAAIAEHDLNIKVSHVTDWLKDGHGVKVFIMSSRSTSVSRA